MRLLPLLLLAATGAVAVELAAPLSDRSPAVDGRILDAEYARAASFDGLAWEGRLERRWARGWITATATDLHVALRSVLPDEGELVAAVDRDAERIVFDDSVELWVDPTPGSERGAAYQLLANARDRRWFAKHPRGGEPGEPGWRAEWTCASSRHDGFWDWEARVPLGSIAPGRPVTEGEWGLNLCRNWKQPWGFSSLGGGGYAPGREVVVRFVPAAPVIGHRQRLDPVTTASTLALESAVPLRVVQRLQRDKMPDVLVDRVVPAGAHDVPLSVEDRGISAKFTLAVEVTSPDGATVFLRRNLAWDALPADWRWTTATPIQPPLDLRFAYYPYLDRLRLLLDASGLPPAARLEAVAIELRPKAGGEPVLRARLAAFDEAARATAELDVPPLDGEYVLAARAVGTGVPEGEVVHPLWRRRYEWERNPAGREPRVYPPFGPLALTGRRLHAVLREHDLNGLGLWDQVTATAAHTGVARELLAAPMRLRVRTADGERPVSPGELRVSQPGDARMVLEGGFTAGPLRATSRCTWDLDGLMRFDLTLAPSPEPIQALTLEIPVHDQAAPLMHAMTEGIRQVIATQAVPPGQGVVWTSQALPGGELPRGFATYCFVGGPVRGLAWCAENDRGWGWDPNTPNVELDRRDGTLVLRVHLINQPTRLDAPRTLSFGLQAAPVKPKLAPWRWRWFRDRYSLLGTDINWFALGDCGAVYPANRDLGLWEWLKRGNQEQLSDAQVEEALAYGRRHWEPYGEERVSSYEAHVRYNLRSRFGARMVFYYNRASYQQAEEWWTFEDEWSLNDYRSVGPGTGLGEIKIVPSESYIDHALWWYAKSFETGGNQGVYWDNWFIVPSHNTQMTEAYRRPDGSVMPAAGIWGLRELSRRTFNFLGERGRLPLTMPHMTSTNLLPLHGFATVQYDWEWKYSEGDVQNRFPREYLLLVSNGELAGCWPVLLADHGNLAEDPWTQRTFAAVSIVHELDPAAATWKSTWPTVWKPLLDPILALLDDPALEVWRYWDERPQPIRADDPDLPTIVYAVPGREAVAAVVSFKAADAEAELIVDARALGFDGPVAVTNAETGEPLAVAGGSVRFRLPKHDIRELRVVPAGAAP